MEPILTPSIINRLRSDGAEILEHLDLSNGLLVPEEMIQIAECIHDYYTAHHSVSPLQTIDLSGNLICGLDEYSDGEYDCSGLNKFVSELLLHGDKRIVCVVQAFIVSSIVQL